jgi:hypothetical protein
MCFSAEASFTAGTMLSVIGVYSVKQVTQRSQLAFAAIPFLFAAQQFSEGMFWLSAGGSMDAHWQAPAVMIFLMFAQVIWPVWVPLSVWLLEPDGRRKKILSSFLALGSLLGAYHLYCLLVYPSGAEISGHHVAYHLDFPKAISNLSGVAYILVTIAPLFVSAVARMRVLGFAIAGSFIVTIYLYTQHFISVWCFFAAVISGIVVWVVSERRATVHTKHAAADSQ